MSVDHVLGIAVIAGAYGLTWYLLLKSTKIVRKMAGQDTEPPHKADPEPEAENGTEDDR